MLVTSYVDFGGRISDIDYLPAGDYMLVALGDAGNFPDGTDNPADGSAYLWDLRNRAQSQIYAGHTNLGRAADISPDGTLIASGSGPLSLPNDPADLDATARIWDAASGEELAVFSGHEHMVDSVRFTLDGQYLLTGSWDGTIRRWDLNSGDEVSRYEIPETRVNMIDVLPNSSQFVSASGDAIIRLWDIESGEVVREYLGHEAQVNGISVSADGTMIVSAAGSFRWRRSDYPPLGCRERRIAADLRGPYLADQLRRDFAE